jgi:hypothetical protein
VRSNCITLAVLPNIVESPLHDGGATAGWPVTRINVGVP